MLCSPLETLLHDWPSLRAVVFLSTEAVLLLEHDSAVAHLLSGIHLSHQLGTVRSEDVLHACGLRKVLTELLVSHAGSPYKHRLNS